MVNPYNKNVNIEEKRKLASIACTLVKNHSIIGLGSGSTIGFFLDQLVKRVNEEKLDLKFIASSKKIEKQAGLLGLHLIDIDEILVINQAFDGADRVDENYNLIKGGGGSLFRERQVLIKAEERFILADSSKLAKCLSGQIIPLEIVPFNASHTIKLIRNMGYGADLRKDGKCNFVTDNGNYIADVSKEFSEPPVRIYEQLKMIPGVVDAGLFLNDDYQLLQLEQS
ncbi:ribose 5-phosphate isomerase A [Sporosarcina cascadiensis]|uniref:ribose 5-phosphate isomerase A n=1 Tax=Sporosarcina cascadiensis TaxID=2660747 RepID=UPI00129AC442|nr:ribose 5-phosphate isomerase A [Sporosarcina cascadiensis]